MTRPIAIVFANLKGNIGDFAILHAMLLHARTHYPGRPVDVWPHGFAPIDRARLAAFRDRAPDFALREDGLFGDRPPGRALTRLLRGLGLLRRHQARRIARIAARDRTAARVFADYEAIHVAGGAQWTGAVSGVAMFGGLRAMQAWNPRISGFPVSVSTAIHRLNRAGALREDLARLRPPIVTRDSASAALLRGLGLDVLEGADCVFSLCPQGEAVPAASSAARDRVLVCVTGQSEATLHAALSALRGAGRPVALLTTCAIEDAPMQEPLAARLGVPFLAPLTWQDTVAEMKGSALVVTNRLHGHILNSFAGVPVLPLTDRSKLRAVVDDARLPMRLDRLADLDGATVNRALASRQDILARMLAYRDAALRRPRAPVTGAA